MILISKAFLSSNAAHVIFSIVFESFLESIIKFVFESVIWLLPGISNMYFMLIYAAILLYFHQSG